MCPNEDADTRMRQHKSVGTFWIPVVLFAVVHDTVTEPQMRSCWGGGGPDIEV